MCNCRKTRQLTSKSQQKSLKRRQRSNNLSSRRLKGPSKRFVTVRQAGR